MASTTACEHGGDDPRPYTSDGHAVRTDPLSFLAAILRRPFRASTAARHSFAVHGVSVQTIRSRPIILAAKGSWEDIDGEETYSARYSCIITVLVYFDGRRRASRCRSDPQARGTSGCLTKKRRGSSCRPSCGKERHPAEPLTTRRFGGRTPIALLKRHRPKGETK